MLHSGDSGLQGVLSIITTFARSEIVCKGNVWKAGAILIECLLTKITPLFLLNEKPIMVRNAVAHRVA